MLTCSTCGTSYNFGSCPTCERNRLLKEQNQILEKNRKLAEQQAAEQRERQYAEERAQRYAKEQNSIPSSEKIRNLFRISPSREELLEYKQEFDRLENLIQQQGMSEQQIIADAKDKKYFTQGIIFVAVSVAVISLVHFSTLNVFVSIIIYFIAGAVLFGGLFGGVFHKYERDRIDYSNKFFDDFKSLQQWKKDETWLKLNYSAMFMISLGKIDRKNGLSDIIESSKDIITKKILIKDGELEILNQLIRFVATCEKFDSQLGWFATMEKMMKRHLSNSPSLQYLDESNNGDENAEMSDVEYENLKSTL
jgi:hypothetical protein